MCARFALTVPPGSVSRLFGLADIDPFPPRFNIAPTQPILAVMAAPPREPGSNLPKRVAVLLRWGLLPSWVKTPKEFPLLINARSESAAEKASFRAAMRHRRVLIPASGFYEWRQQPKTEAPARRAGQPFWVRPRDAEEGLVAFAGLMETYSDASGGEIDTGAILTTAATGALAAIHPRMPVVIHAADFDRWLDCRTQEPRDVADLLAAPPDDFFEALPVSDAVNKATASGPELQTPVAVEQDDTGMPPAGQLSLF
jgi:putative SOS response-associated peptidase YedK